MKKFYFGLVSAVLFALAACTQDPADGPLNPGVDSDGNSVYLDVALSLPSVPGSRSETDNEDENTGDSTGSGQTPSDGKDADGNYDGNPDYEQGQDYENTIRELLLVIADESGKYLVHSVVSSLPSTSLGQSGNYEVAASAKFDMSAIEALYNENGAFYSQTEDASTKFGQADFEFNTKVKLFAFCNPTNDLKNYFENTLPSAGDAVKSGDYTTIGTNQQINGSWLNKALTLSETVAAPYNNFTDVIWNNNKFLMTNAVEVTAELPKTAKAWEKYTSVNHPFHLSDENENDDPDNSIEGRGPIKVERAAARFDFKDVTNEDTPATYKITGKQTIYDETEETEDDKIKPNTDVNLFTVQLVQMSLVNLHNSYYALRRVSNDGTSTSWRYGKYETINNFVVDVDWGTKRTAQKGVDISDVRKNYHYPLFKELDSNFNNYQYESESNWLTTKMTDVLGGTQDKWTGTQAPYHIWCYVTENTFPEAQNNSPEVSAYDNQRVAYTTGIVFKAQIKAGVDGANGVDAVYAVKKTVPDTDNEGQFKEVIDTKPFISNDAKALLRGTNVTEDSPALYMHRGLVFAGFDELVAEAYLDNTSAAYDDVKEILSHWYTTGNGTEFAYAATAPSEEGSTQLTPEIYWAMNIAEDDDFVAGEYETKEQNPLYQYKSHTITGIDTSKEFKALATGKNITIYEVEPGPDGTYGYYCYYFYWNRHNDNGNNAKMGKMEFATVRNNVYKLSVSKIGQLGHPTLPDNDPDPVDPDDPDEEESVYMDVQVEILPWVVRVNDIEF